MRTQQHADRSSAYVCPMHPDVTGKVGDKCSKCGMDLKAVQQGNSKEFQVDLSTSPHPIEAGKPTQLTFVITRGEQVVPLEVSHEMKIHLMVVSEDLGWFHHIHPEEQTDGSYAIVETFPSGGKHLLFVDFKPMGAAQTLNVQEVEVQGSRSENIEDSSNKWITRVDAYKVRLINASDFQTNKTQDLEISIEKDGKELIENDLHQYLGASAHIVMIGKSDKEFLHIHPVSDSRFPIFAQTHIERAGIYRMWVQFKIDGHVHTADFTVNVTKGVKKDNEEKHHQHQE